MKIAAAVVWAAAALGMAGHVHAQPPHEGPLIVEVHVDACAAVDAAEVRRVAALELHALVSDPSEPDARRTRAEASCVGNAVHLAVRDPITSKSLARDIAWSSVAAPSRTRLLALAIAELVTASWSELETNPEPVAQPAEPPAPPEDRSAALHVVTARTHVDLLRSKESPQPPTPRARTSWRALTFADARTFGATPLAGVGVRLGVDFADFGGVALDAVAEESRSDSDLGSVRLTSLSFGAAALARYELAPITLRFGPGARFGFARARGDADPTRAIGRSIDGAWGAPVLGLAASVALLRRLVVELGVEGGWAPVGVRGSVYGQSDARVEGLFLAASLGIGMHFDPW